MYRGDVQRIQRVKHQPAYSDKQKESDLELFIDISVPITTEEPIHLGSNLLSQSGAPVQGGKYEKAWEIDKSCELTAH